MANGMRLFAILDFLHDHHDRLYECGSCYPVIKSVTWSQATFSRSNQRRPQNFHRSAVPDAAKTSPARHGTTYRVPPG